MDSCFHKWGTPRTTYSKPSRCQRGAPSAHTMNKTSRTNNKRQGKSKRQSRNNANKLPRQPVQMSGNSNTIVDSFLPIFPNVAVRKLRYTTANILSVSSGVLTTHVFSLNGLYDPDYTGTGHQPMGFDQMMPFYNHYHVTKAKVHVIFSMLEADRAGSIGIKVTPDTTPPGSFENLIEEGRNSWDTIAGAASTTNGTKALRCSVNVPAINGLTRANYLADTEYQGTIIANPSEQTFIHICAWSSPLISFSVRFDIVIEYEAAFTEPRNLTPSHLAAIRAVEQKQAGDAGNTAAASVKTAVSVNPFTAIAMPARR